MARRAFSKPVELGKIVGLPAEFISGINNLWIAIRSSKRINPEKFDIYAKNVKKMYFDAKLDWVGFFKWIQNHQKHPYKFVFEAYVFK